MGHKVSTLDNLNVLNIITVNNGNFDIGGKKGLQEKSKQHRQYKH